MGAGNGRSDRRGHGPKPKVVTRVEAVASQGWKVKRSGRQGDSRIPGNEGGGGSGCGGKAAEAEVWPSLVSRARWNRSKKERSYTRKPLEGYVTAVTSRKGTGPPNLRYKRGHTGRRRSTSAPAGAGGHIRLGPTNTQITVAEAGWSHHGPDTGDSAQFVSHFSRWTTRVAANGTVGGNEPLGEEVPAMEIIGQIPADPRRPISAREAPRGRARRFLRNDSTTSGSYCPSWSPDCVRHAAWSPDVPRAGDDRPGARTRSGGRWKDCRPGFAAGPAAKGPAARRKRAGPVHIVQEVADRWGVESDGSKPWCGPSSR
jgi:hypothetical protein